METVGIPCLYCLEKNEASLEKNTFVCQTCGEKNEYDNEKYKDQQRVILKRVFGERPKKPENN